MQKRNRFAITLGVSICACLGWLLWLKEVANYAIDHPVITNLVGVFALAVGGGVVVSLIPQWVWAVIPTNEDEITGEDE
jgi:hypothetical protein